MKTLVPTAADPRQIEKCFPQENAIWQIDFFDEATGAFAAHVIGD